MPSLVAGRPQMRPKKKLKPSLEPLPAASNGSAASSSSQRDGESSFARALASVDASTRIRALDALVAWLVARGKSGGKKSDGPSPPGVSRADMIKIWKGLFYAFWHSDLAPVQGQLATRLANIAGELQPELSLLYLDSFYQTMAREWPGIDRLRLDKFMMLTRRFVAATFGLAAGRKVVVGSVVDAKDGDSSPSPLPSSAAAVAAASPWSPNRVERLLKPLFDAMCPPADAPLLLSGSGFGLHLADVSAGEFLRAVDDTPSPSSSSLSDGVLAAFLPFARAAAETQRPELCLRLGREFFSKVAAAAAAAGGERGERRTEPLSRLASAAPAQLLSLASREGTRARNRGVLYAAAAEMEEAVAAPAAATEAPTPRDKSKAKKREQREQRDKEASPEQQQHPSSSKKGKKRPAEAPPTPPTAAPSKAQENEAAKAAAGAAATADAKKAKTPATASKAAEKKRVQWSLKSNLAHAVGGPVPPPHVRTPPGSKPKGSALKVRLPGAATRSATAAAAAAEAERTDGVRARASLF